MRARDQELISFPSQSNPRLEQARILERDARDNLPLHSRRLECPQYGPSFLIVRLGLSQGVRKHLQRRALSDTGGAEDCACIDFLFFSNVGLNCEKAENWSILYFINSAVIYYLFAE